MHENDAMRSLMGEAEHNTRRPKPKHALRRALSGFICDGFFQSAGVLGRLHPRSHAQRHGVEVERNRIYSEVGQTKLQLDIYRPQRKDKNAAQLPTVLYVHGGGFRILSKDSHRAMAIAFAEQGYLVCNINYRLAPKHPYPAALEDVCTAYLWLVQNIKDLGGDLNRIVLAGESAGANLVTSLAIAACFPRSEQFAASVYQCGIRPKAVIAACGLFQVSNTARFRQNPSLSQLVHDRLIDIEEAYLPHHTQTPAATNALQETHAGALPQTPTLADPLLCLEQARQTDHLLPDFFLPVGEDDPIREDTVRLDETLRKLRAHVETQIYPNAGHAFHTLVFTRSAQQCWQDCFRFLNTFGQ